MARRNKRASMREGPLADLFRSTSQPEEDVDEPREYEPVREEETDVMRSETVASQSPEPTQGEPAVFDHEVEGPASGPAAPGREAEEAGSVGGVEDADGIDDVTVYRTT